MSPTLTLKHGNTPAGADAQTLESALAELAAVQAALLTSQAETADAHAALNASKAETADAHAALNASKAEAAEAAAKVAPATETLVEKPEPSQYATLVGKRTWLKTVHGDMTNLHTGEVFTTDPKKSTVDQFILNQLDAGKMAIHVEED